jgi:hypothetical protein
MTESTALEVANDGDVLSGAGLQESIDRLKTMADELNPFLATETSVDAAQAIGQAQQQLRSLATSLVVAQIDLLAGEVKVTAEHINAAVEYTDDVISQIAGWKKRMDKIGELLDFFAVVLTGKGADILQAARKLKAAVDAG